MADKVDIIGGFPDARPGCRGCLQPLTIENAWMTDGCPCNSPLGVNSMNETRWSLLMELQQRHVGLLRKIGTPEIGTEIRRALDEAEPTTPACKKMHVPGGMAQHAVITDQCRTAFTDDRAFDIAVEQMRTAYKQASTGYPVGNGVQLHLMLTIERPKPKDGA